LGFSRDDEMESIREYGDTLRSSALIIALGFTTVVIEGIALGTPAIVVASNTSADGEKLPPDRSDWWLPWHREQALRHPGRGELKIATDMEELKHQIVESMDPNYRSEYIADGLVASTSMPADGKSGERWVAAVRRLMDDGTGQDAG
jgi:hypothetical protein